MSQGIAIAIGLGLWYLTRSRGGEYSTGDGYQGGQSTAPPTETGGGPGITFNVEPPPPGKQGPANPERITNVNPFASSGPNPVYFAGATREQLLGEIEEPINAPGTIPPPNANATASFDGSSGNPDDPSEVAPPPPPPAPPYVPPPPAQFVPPPSPTYVASAPLPTVKFIPPRF
jgi:hypothetical protein